MWQYEPTDEYLRARKWYAKKRPDESAAVHDNLAAYRKALEMGMNPLNASAFGFIHDERHGVFACDQKTNNSDLPVARKGKNLRLTRLYFYPEVDTRTIWLLTIGDKDSQQSDIQKCPDFVGSRRKEVENEANRKTL